MEIINKVNETFQFDTRTCCCAITGIRRVILFMLNFKHELLQYITFIRKCKIILFILIMSQSIPWLPIPPPPGVCRAFSTIPQNTTQKSISIVFSVSAIRHDSSLSKYRKQKQSPLEIFKMAHVQGVTTSVYGTC